MFRKNTVLAKTTENISLGSGSCRETEVRETRLDLVPTTEELKPVQEGLRASRQKGLQNFPHQLLPPLARLWESSIGIRGKCSGGAPRDTESPAFSSFPVA